MSDIVEPLIVDLVAWVARAPRSYAEVLDAWRTSCPRLTVWEDAIDRGYLARRSEDGRTVVVVTPAGRALITAAAAIPSPPQPSLSPRARRRGARGPGAPRAA